MLLLIVLLFVVIMVLILIVLLLVVIMVLILIVLLLIGFGLALLSYVRVLKKLLYKSVKAPPLVSKQSLLTESN